MDGEAQLYESYIELKKWGVGLSDIAREVREFDSWIKPYLRVPRSNILEVGFGDGTFMHWARENGHLVSGVEIIPKLVEAAKSSGFSAYPSMDFPQDGFDTIVAIDVLEHLNIDQLSAMLALMKDKLTPGGFIIARFPNGASPFSAYYQTGDATHLKPLSPRALEQIALPSGLVLSKVFNPRITPKGLSGIKLRLAYGARNIVETVLGFIYLGIKIPLDPNIAVILRQAT